MGTRAHTCYPRSFHPPSNAYLLTEAALTPSPARNAAAPWGSQGTRIQTPPHCKAKPKAARSVLPAFNGTTKAHRSGGRLLSTHPGLTMSVWGGGFHQLVLLSQLHTGRLQGLPQRSIYRREISAHPSPKQLRKPLFLSKAVKQEIPVS